MIIFINFVCTLSSTPTSSAVLITYTASVSLSLINDDSLYIKFLNSSLFNNNHNKYLIWKQKIFDKLLAENQKYVKMRIQADYFQQHYINSHLNNSTTVKALLWLNLNSNTSIEEFWIFINSQFKDNQLIE